MISSIQIDGYRGFEHFEMGGLGRLNLLVGTNNSGKTSVLEALYLLTSQGDPLALWNLLWRRGERLPGSTQSQSELDVCHLFYGHEVHIGSKFTLSATNESPSRRVAFTIAEFKPKQPEGLFEGTQPVGLALVVRGEPKPPVSTIPLTRVGGLSTDAFNTSRRLRRKSLEGSPSQFITAESLDSDDLVALWDKVALTPDETLVMRALQFLDRDIERIASQSASPSYYHSHGGFIIKLRGHERPIPIGTMGDGMWRMLAMAIAITQCKGGVLLVDEIDTGLHYSVMSDMWRLIFGAAKELNVQVFATTHSYDCIQSLASVCLSDRDHNNPVTLQRIEMGKSKAVPYSESEIVVASDREIEVR
jgi:AAA domain, putative AbiEii toxin, Type IV TA system/AAA ATPase domain